MIDPKRGERIGPFSEWIKKVPEDRLRQYVIDAYWKGNLDNHDLLRAFIAETEYGVNMIPENQGKA